MKWFFRWLFRLVILLIVLAVSAVLLLNPIARELMVYRLKRDTGMDVKIGRFDVGLLDPGLTIENLVLYNTSEFGGSPFVEVPELRVEYARGNFFSRKPHYKLVRLDLKQVNVVEDRKGRSNFEILEDLISPDEHSRTNAGPRPLRTRSPIDTLNLTLGKATFMSMNHPGRVDQLIMNVHNQVVTNIKPDQDLTAVLLTVLIRNGITMTGNAADWLGRLASPPPQQRPAKSSP